MDTKILEYQKKEKEKINIKKAITSSEEYRRASKAQKFLKEVERNIEDMDAKAGELTKEYDKLVEKNGEMKKDLVVFSEQLEKSTDKKEAEYLLKKVSEFEKNINDLSNEISNIQFEINTLINNFKEYRKKVKIAKSEYETYKIKYEELKKPSQSKITKINSELKALASEIDEDLMKQYLAIRKKKIFPVVVPLRDNNCGGCMMDLSISKCSELKKKGNAVCDECGRIIYIEEK